MRLELMYSACDDGKTCPALYQTDRNSVIVRGWVVARPELAGSDDVPAVEVPAMLLAKAAEGRPGPVRAGSGTVMVRGLAVTDPTALRHLCLPAWEDVVEVSADDFAEVLRAC
jgi:hypothetical protein